MTIPRLPMFETRIAGTYTSLSIVRFPDLLLDCICQLRYVYFFIFLFSPQSYNKKCTYASKASNYFHFSISSDIQHSLLSPFPLSLSLSAHSFSHHFYTQLAPFFIHPHYHQQKRSKLTFLTCIFFPSPSFPPCSFSPPNSPPTCSFFHKTRMLNQKKGASHIMTCSVCCIIALLHKKKCSGED